MIQQSSANLASIVIDPKPVMTLPDDPEGQWHGYEVIRLVSELVRSINPFYVPDNSLPTVPGVAAGIDLPALDNQTSHCQGFTNLAARTINAWANLPPEIDQALGYLANLLAVGQAASDQFEALSAPPVPEPGTDRENAPDETVENVKKKTGKAPQYPRRQPDKPATAMLRASQLPNTPLALGALVGFSAVGASSASGSKHWQSVNTADELKNICNDETRYPCDGKYWLTRDITIDSSQWQPIGSGKRPFRGELNSVNRTIRNLPDCLTGNLAGNGKIQNLRFTSANIVSARKAAGVVACRMSGNASVSNIHVKHANLVANCRFASAGIVVGIVNAGTVFNIIARNCTVTGAGAKAGIGAGLIKAGIGAGLIKEGGMVDKTMAVNCNVSIRDKHAEAGIWAGENKGIVSNTLAFKCHVSTSGDYATAGIGAGKNKGTVIYTTANKCTVLTDGHFSNAGIGAGYNSGTVKYTTAYKCTLSTNGVFSHAGIGAGHSRRGASSNWTVIIDTAAFGCNVSTTKTSSTAGIGAGYIEYQGSIDKTTAVKCTVKTSGTQSDAGIGAGKTGIGTGETGPGIKRGINNTRVIASTVKSEKEDSNAAINGGNKPTVCNATIIKGQKTQYETVNCHIDSNTACEGFDPRLVRKNCQEVPGGLFGTNAPPTYPATEPFTTVSTSNISSLDSDITTTPPTTPAKSTNTISVGQGSVTIATLATTPAPLSSSKMPLTIPGSATSATPPTTPAPLSRSNLPLSSPGSSATITTPSSNAPTVSVMTAFSSVSTQLATPPLTKAPSPAFIASIAILGTAIIVLIGVIGAFTYRNYCRRSSANAGSNQPMAEQPERLLRAVRQLPSAPPNDYQLLPIRPVNTSALPASLQSHYQPLSGRQGNTATGSSNPNPDPPPSDYPEQPVYENIAIYRIPLADGQAHTVSAGSTTPGQQGPVHPLMTEPETDSDDSYDEPVMVTPEGMATGGSSYGEHW